MAIDVAKAFEANSGFRPNDNGTAGPFYTGGPASPVGLDLPVDSFYVQNQGAGGVVFWRKYGTGVNDWTKTLANDFYQETVNEGNSTTTSTTTYANKLTLNTPTLPLGDYVVEWTFRWLSANANRGVQVRVFDGTTEFVNCIDFTASVSQQTCMAGFAFLNGISGSKTFTLDFRVGIGSTTITMSHARFMFRRKA